MEKPTSNLDPDVKSLLDKYPDVTKPSMGKIKNYEARLHIDPTVDPLFYKARPVPYNLWQKLDEEFDRLLREDIMEPIEMSEWATPIVTKIKPDGSLRICCDFSLTVNRVAKLDKYPMPSIEHVHSKLANAACFSEIDLSHAYHQMQMNPESTKYMVINTHRGLFRYKRLSFGIHSAPGIFQRFMDMLLSDIPNVLCHMDNIIIVHYKSESRDQHLKTIEEVLKRLNERNIRINLQKSSFLKEVLESLGFTVTSEGLKPTESKLNAIQNAPRPTNIKQVEAYLGLLQFYHKFLPNLATITEPLNELRRKNVPFVWSSRQETAFKKTKEAIEQSDILVHYDPEKQVILQCDASEYGSGAVLQHVMEDGTRRPIAFTSKTFQPCERKYSNIEREALSLVRACKKWHLFLLGRPFQVECDHKPLEKLFGTPGLPKMCSARLANWALTLSAYNFTWKYKSGKDIPVADGLSRLPLKASASPEPGLVSTDTVYLFDEYLPLNVMNTTFTDLDQLPITSTVIARETVKDKTLSKVLLFLEQNSWPNHTTDDDIKPYLSRKDELTVMKSCIMWGHRVVIPQKLHDPILDVLHCAHPGIVRMKSLARSYVWFPGIDKSIEHLVRSCHKCQENRQHEPKAPLHPWEVTKAPWQRLHMDYFSVSQGDDYFLVVDSYSKWIEVFPMKSTTSYSTIKKLMQIFATHGLPKQLVSDNAPNFVSHEMREFLKANGIHQIFASPYHPSSNGLAERSVKLAKSLILKAEPGDINTKLAKVLFQYRITPQTTTNLSPAELLMNRKLHNPLSLLKPSITDDIERQQDKMKAIHDRHAKPRSFAPGDHVYIRNYREGKMWLSGIITKRTGPLSYHVDVSGVIMKRHIDQIRVRYDIDDISNDNNDPDELDEPVHLPVQKPEQKLHQPIKPRTPSPTWDEIQVPRRVSKRSTKGVPPKRYSPS